MISKESSFQPSLSEVHLASFRGSLASPQCVRKTHTHTPWPTHWRNVQTCHQLVITDFNQKIPMFRVLKKGSFCQCCVFHAFPLFTEFTGKWHAALSFYTMLWNLQDIEDQLEWGEQHVLSITLSAQLPPAIADSLISAFNRLSDR